MPLDTIDGKTVIGTLFRRDTWDSKEDVDFWLMGRGYDPDEFRVEESPENFRVLFPGPALAQFDPDTYERFPEPNGTPGVSVIVSEMHSLLQFDERLRVRLSDFAPGQDPRNLDERTTFKALHTGDFKHGLQEIELTKDILETMHQNFKKDVLKKGPLPIDYSHNNHERASGWIETSELRDNGNELWVTAHWTKNGLQSLRDREFRGFSAEFDLDYTDTETGETFGAVLRGGGLTNIPFLKGTEIFPLSQCSDATRHRLFSEPKKEDPIMGPDAISFAEAKVKITQLEERVLELAREKTRLQGVDEKHTALSTQFKEVDAKRIELQTKLNVQEKTMQFNEMISAGEVVEGQRTFFMESKMVEFAKAAMATNLDKGDGNPVVRPNVPNTPNPGGEYQMTELEKKYMRFGSYSRDTYVKANKLTAKSPRPN